MVFGLGGRDAVGVRVLAVASPRSRPIEGQCCRLLEFVFVDAVFARIFTCSCVMSSDKQGWLSAVSRLFSGGGHTLSPVAESCSVPARNLRYLSPSALETGVSQPGVSKPVAFDRSSVSCITSRKRILTQDDHPSTAVDTLLCQENPKRSRREQFASTMLENLSPRLLSAHLDSRMNRSVGVPSSSVEFLHSPISNRSLIERIGSNRSNASSLSSKTRAILSHLERINTPAREARKLPVMRGSTLPSERWAPMNSSTTAPPLVKTNANVPSRIQLLSASLASQRKPYWRDITRTAKDKDRSPSPKRDRTSGNSSVHPLFDMENTNSFGVDSCLSSRSPQANVGSEQTARNGHSVEDTDTSFGKYGIEVGNIFLGGYESGIPVCNPATVVASSEFREDMVFKFDAPVEPQLGQLLDEDEDLTLEERGESTNPSESSNSDSEDEQQSSVSEAEEINAPVRYGKNSRPSTAADSETSADVSTAITPVSSKDVSPQTKVETSLKCPNCSNTNKDVSTCTACGLKNEGSIPSKSPISNVTSYVRPAVSHRTSADGPEIPAGCRIDSTDTRHTNLEPPSISKSLEAPTPVVANPDSVSVPTCSQSFVIKNVPEANKERRSEIGESEERKDWECPDCIASYDKCVCCGHVMYKSDHTQTSFNVFGERAFKVGATPSTFSFGFTGSNDAPSSGKTIKFGFGASDWTKSATTNTDLSFSKAATIPPENPNPLVSPEPGKDTIANISPELDTTKGCAEPKPLTFSVGAGAAVFGSEPKPPLFGSLSSSTLKSSSTTGSFLPVSSNSTFVNASTVITAGNSSQVVPNSAPTAFVFGSASSKDLSGQSGLLNVKPEGNNPTGTTPFGNNVSFGALPNNNAKVLSSTTCTSGSSAEATNMVPSTSVNIFGGAGAAKPVFSSFGITSESATPFTNTNTSTGSQDVSPFKISAGNSSEIQKPLFGIGATTASKPFFGASTSTISNSNGGLSFNFGQTNTFGGFGTSASSSAVSSSLPTTSSNPSIFGSAASVTEAPKSFQFNTTLPESIFQFGQTPLTGSTPFQFGSSQLATSAVPWGRRADRAGPTIAGRRASRCAGSQFSRLSFLSAEEADANIVRISLHCDKFALELTDSYRKVGRVN
uniref:RanBP2-type domain-containing protein n=1 Tax=Angiostrongylus cantonensis TaxID=6313 RepID=A0A0K0CVT9_ANGCA